MDPRRITYPVVTRSGIHEMTAEQREFYERAQLTDAERIQRLEARVDALEKALRMISTRTA